MKKLLLVLSFLMVSMSSMAQVVSTPSTDLYQIGSAFGSTKAWQFGIDKSATVGGCVQREIHDGQWLGGPCRDIFQLDKNGQHRFHLGAAIMYNSQHGNATYSARVGFNAGPVLGSAFSYVVNNLPYLESLSDVQAPKFIVYIGHVTTIDMAIGYRPIHTNDVIGSLTYGPMVKMDIPLEDIYALLKLGL